MVPAMHFFPGTLFAAAAVVAAAFELSSDDKRCAKRGHAMMQWRAHSATQSQTRNETELKEMEGKQLLLHLMQQAPPKLTGSFNRMAVNLGAGDGRAMIPGMNCSTLNCDGPNGDPVYPIYNSLNFGGLAVEGDPSLQEQLNQNLPARNVTKKIYIITPMNVVQLLKEGNIPTDVDYFKNDIDSYDCAVSYAALIAGFRPKMIQVEVNPEIPYPIAFGINYAKSFNPKSYYHGFYGCSVTLTSGLFHKFGYQLVSVAPLHDALYVRKDFMTGLQPLSDKAASEAFAERFRGGIHLGNLSQEWMKIIEQDGSAKAMENMTAEMKKFCALSQGNSAKCNVPFTVSLNAHDYVAQLNTILTDPAEKS